MKTIYSKTVFVITRSRVHRYCFLLINFRCLGYQFSVTYFNLYKLREVRPLRVGVFIISSCTRNYILYCGKNYLGMSVSVPPWMDLSMSRWMVLWITYFCDYNSVLIPILFWSPSMRQSATHSCGNLWLLICCVFQVVSRNIYDFNSNPRGSYNKE